MSSDVKILKIFSFFGQHYADTVMVDSNLKGLNLFGSFFSDE